MSDKVVGQQDKETLPNHLTRIANTNEIGLGFNMYTGGRKDDLPNTRRNSNHGCESRSSRHSQRTCLHKEVVPRVKTKDRRSAHSLLCSLVHKPKLMRTSFPQLLKGWEQKRVRSLTVLMQLSDDSAMTSTVITTNLNKLCEGRRQSKDVSRCSSQASGKLNDLIGDCFCMKRRYPRNSGEDSHEADSSYPL
jgi:hypothetical protein